MGENDCYFGHNIARGSGGTTGWTQSRTKKLSLGVGFYVTIAWKGFFTQSQVLLSSMVDHSSTAPVYMNCLQNANFEKTHKLFDYKLGHVPFFLTLSASRRVACWLLAHSWLSWPGLVRASFLLATRFLNCAYGFSRKVTFSLINSSNKQLLQLINVVGF